MSTFDNTRNRSSSNDYTWSAWMRCALPSFHPMPSSFVVGCLLLQASSSMQCFMWWFLYLTYQFCNVILVCFLLLIGLVLWFGCVQSTWRWLPGCNNGIMFCHSNFGPGCMPCSWACRVTGSEGASPSHNAWSVLHFSYRSFTRLRGLSSPEGITVVLDYKMICMSWAIL